MSRSSVNIWGPAEHHNNGVDVMRTVSSEGIVQLEHPMPDLQALQGAYVHNIERLEQHADRISMGSDLAEEIRRLREEQRESESRHSSMRFSLHEETLERTRSRRTSWVKQRPRNLSASSHAHSIVEVNKEARYGGYSPAGFVNVGSPRGSIRSATWSQVSISRTRSHGKHSNQLQASPMLSDGSIVNSPIDETDLHSEYPPPGAFGSALEASFSEMYDHRSHSDLDPTKAPPNRSTSDGSFSRLYNQIAAANESPGRAASVRTPSHAPFAELQDYDGAAAHEELDPVTEEVPFHEPSSLDRTPRDERQLGILDGQDGLTHGRAAMDDAVGLRHSIYHPNEVSGKLQVRNLDDIAFDATSAVEASSLDPAMSSITGRASAAVKDRPTTAGSTDTYQQAQLLFQDFDGSHAAPSIRSHLLHQPDHAGSRPISVLHELRSSPNLAPPPPADGMVYYPAPVPRQLNLPQRLSHLPAAGVQAKRRTQMLGSLPADARKSAVWLGPDKRQSTTELLDKRQSTSNNSGSLPPQLRASMFFDGPGSQEEIDIKQESAVATLDDLLNASALAPVAAFTHHPFAGRDGAKVYRKDRMVRTSTSMVQLQASTDGSPQRPNARSRMSTFLGLGGKPAEGIGGEQSGDSPSKLRTRISSTFSVGKLEGVSRGLSSSGDIAGTEGLYELNGVREGGARVNDPLLAENEDLDEEEYEDYEDEEEFDEYDEDQDEEHDYSGPPTTLLAELQIRKAQQKSRNLTAAKAFPNGMHSTLLELDAVTQLEKSKRKRTRVPLAWEDAEVHKAFEEKDDEDVPLAVLFPKTNKAGLPEQNRPLGLLEKKEMEDNEPLSNRRNRLLGLPSPVRGRSPTKSAGAIFRSRQDPEEVEDEAEAGETLAQRMRRLRSKKELDEALGDVDGQSFSEAFSELLKIPGVPNETGTNRDVTKTPQEDETLGQRRARLQREREVGQINPPKSPGLPPSPNRDGVNAASSPNRPGMRNSRNMSDLLSAFPGGETAGKRRSSGNLMSPDGLERDGLVQQSEKTREAKRKSLMETNTRSASYGTEGNPARPFLDLAGQPGSAVRRKSGAFMNGIYNTGTGGQGQNPANVAPSYHMYGAQGNAMGMAGGVMQQQFPGTPQTMPYGFNYGLNPSMPFLPMQQTQGMYGMSGQGTMFPGQNVTTPMQDPYSFGQMNPYFAVQQPQAMTQGSHGPAPPLTHRASMSSSNLLANMGGGLQGQQSRALHQQQQQNHYLQQHGMLSAMPVGMPADSGLMVNGQPLVPGLDFSPLDPKARSRIDNWRQNIAS